MEWRRSSRKGSVFHAHVLGFTACRAIRFDRHKSQPLEAPGDVKYWGVCPRCYRMALKAMAATGLDTQPREIQR